MMKHKDDTLEETLLDMAEDIVKKNGIDALSIRKLASSSHIANGTVYNYFQGKDDILLSLTERYWKKEIVSMKEHFNQDFFPDRLEAIYDYLKSLTAGYAGELMGGFQNTGEGLRRMHFMFAELGAMISEGMARDARVKKDLWNDRLSESEFSNFVIINLTSSLRMNAPNIDVLTEVVRRVLYK